MLPFTDVDTFAPSGAGCCAESTCPALATRGDYCPVHAMNEATRTRTVLQTIRKAHPTAFIWKINDAITGGIPDAVIVLHGHTVWVEFKIGKPRTPVEKLLTDLQQLKIRSLVVAGATVVVAILLPDGEMRVYEPTVRDGVFVCDVCPQPSLRAYLERRCTDPTRSTAAAQA